MHFNPWILHTPTECPYFQQFLHNRTSGFMLASLTGLSNYHNETSNIEPSVDNCPGFETILCIPNVDPDNRHV